MFTLPGALIVIQLAPLYQVLLSITAFPTYGRVWCKECIANPISTVKLPLCDNPVNSHPGRIHPECLRLGPHLCFAIGFHFHGCVWFSSKKVAEECRLIYLDLTVTLALRCGGGKGVRSTTIAYPCLGDPFAMDVRAIFIFHVHLPYL